MRKLFNSAFKVTQTFANKLMVDGKDYYGQFGLAGHEGLDLIPSGTVWDVFCLEDGVVVKDEDNARSGAYGINVTVWHPKIKKATQYCHLAENYVSNGQSIKAGEKLGKMGATGNVSGAHVHLNLFETDEEGYRKNRGNGYLGGIDPLPFLNENTEPISASTPQPVITDQTRIPQLGNMEVQAIRSKIADMERDLKSYEENTLNLIHDAEKAQHDLAEYIRQHPEVPVEPKIPSKTDEEIKNGATFEAPIILTNLIQWLKNNWK